ncbi:MAG: PD-(D/E)XK nuclease family protein [Candidatus Latescibacteria bacterium]|nr:PD-(D/E)XK nuclease family protein [Candidatus Latescibacterota bacterium]
MNFTVFSGPDPAANLDELLKRTPISLGPVCVIVPDSRSIQFMEKKLAGLSGNACLGQKIYTFNGLASAILTYSGKKTGLIREHEKRAILHDVICQRIGENSQYRSVSRYPGFLNVLITYLRDMRSSVIENENNKKYTELTAIAAAYDRRLKSFEKDDQEGIIVSALQGDYIEQFSIQFQGPLIVDGFYDLTDHQFNLIRRLSNCFVRCAATLPNDVGNTELFSLPGMLLKKYRSIGAKVITVENTPKSVPECVLKGFRDGEFSRGNGGNVEIHTFFYESSEADWICGTIRALIHDGICRPDEIMIVTGDLPSFGSCIDRALKHHGLPVTGDIKRNFAHHPVIQLIICALKASISADENLINLVQKSCYTGGRERSYPISYANSMDDKIWSCMIAEHDSPKGYADSLKGMLCRLNIEKNLSENTDINLKLSELSIYGQFLILLDEFVEIYSQFNKMMRASEFERLLVEFLESVNVSENFSPKRGILVVDSTMARHINRKVVFITGLDNVSYPKKHTTFTLHEQRMANKIRERHDKEEELLFYLAGSGAEHLYFTFPGVDDEGGYSSISPFLKKICDGISAWSTPSLHFGLPGAAWEGGIVDERGRDENIIRVFRNFGLESLNIIDSLSGNLSSKKAKIRAAFAGYSNRTEKHDLNLNDFTMTGQIAEDWGENKVFTVTALEKYIRCPVSFFISSVLGLSLERFEENEIAAFEIGSFIHEILARFYVTRLNQTGHASFKRNEIQDCKQLMTTIVEQTITPQSNSERRIHPLILLAERKQLINWMNAFIDAEAAYFEKTGFEPIFFETDFGKSRNKDKPDFDPLILEYEGQKVLIGGRIDRIDIISRASGNIVRIIDYKTGAVTASIKDLEEGKVLQIPIYLKAAIDQIVDKAKFFDGVYYSLRELNLKHYKDRSTREPIQGEEWDVYIHTACMSAYEAATLIRKGRFPVRPDTCDEFCEFKGLCSSARLASEK